MKSNIKNLTVELDTELTNEQWDNVCSFVKEAIEENQCDIPIGDEDNELTVLSVTY